MTTLHAIECWVLSAITHPGPHEQLGAIVHDTPDWPAVERLGVYRNAYLARLVECLQAEFPVFRQTVGEGLFDEFALDYLQAHPPASYTLSVLGRRFPEFLAERRPPRGAAQIPDWADFLADLAAFEWTLSEVFDGPGVERRTSASTARPLPESMNVVFECDPSLRLQTYRFPVGDYHAALKTNADLDVPPAQTTHVAFVRRDYVVRHDVLGSTELALLERLQCGSTLATALDSLCEEDVVQHEIAEHIGTWFTSWSQRGYLRAARSSESFLPSTSPLTP